MPLLGGGGSPVTPPQRTAMRTQVRRTLSDTCTIERNTPTSDGMGGFEETWAPLATGVPCRVVSAGGLSENERVVAERMTTDQPWLVYLPSGQDVTPRDRLVVGVAPDTIAYEVLAVNSGQTDEVVRRCVCRRAT